MHSNLMKTKPDNSMMFTVRLMIIMHSFDLVTYTFDYLMVIKRWKFFISTRFITCTVSFVVGIIIQVSFYRFTMSTSGDNVDFVMNFQDNIYKLLILTVVYIYQSYLVWAIMNTIMYF